MSGSGKDDNVTCLPQLRIHIKKQNDDEKE